MQTFLDIMLFGLLMLGGLSLFAVFLVLVSMWFKRQDGTEDLTH